MSRISPTVSRQKKRKNIRILFLQDHLLNESLPLTECISLLRKKGFPCALLVENEEPSFYRKIAILDPDLLAVSADVGNEEWITSTLRKVQKACSKPLLLFGSLPTLSPSKAASLKADFYLIGETEQSFLHFLEEFVKGKNDVSIEGVYSRENFPASSLKGGKPLDDLDALPLPAREVYFRYPALGAFPLKKFVAGRGCPFRCAFCYISPLKKIYNGNPHLRVKSPDRVVEEIFWVKKRYPLQFVHFSDDVFGWDKEWLLSFCELYAKKIGLPFDCNTIASLMNETALEALADAGCKGIAIGVEVAHESTRMELLGKPIRNHQITLFARNLRKRKIALITYNMIGIPGLSKSTDEATLSFNRTLKPKVARVQIAYPMPGTDISVHSKTCKKNSGALQMLKTSFPFFVHHRWLGSHYWKGNAPLKMLSPIFSLYAMWQEKKFYNLPLSSCARLYWKTGGMANRTKNINLSLP